METWSHQGAVATAKATHEQIRNALNASDSVVHGRSFEVFLQGSYKNDTNIRGDSDVDVVVQLNETFRRDISALPVDQQTLYKSEHQDATYSFDQFRGEVLRSLRNKFGTSSISTGNKSLKVSGGSGRLPADVIVCLQYRKYRSYQSLTDQRYVEGIAFNAQDGSYIINFPAQHYDNGVTKNSNTHDCYKPSVRMFKNAREYLVSHQRITSSLAPSYFLECLIYNAPDERFADSFQQTYSEVVNWLVNADLASMICQNGQLELFGNSSEQWQIDSAHRFVKALIDLWNGW